MHVVFNVMNSAVDQFHLTLIIVHHGTHLMISLSSTTSQEEANGLVSHNRVEQTTNPVTMCESHRLDMMGVCHRGGLQISFELLVTGDKAHLKVKLCVKHHCI